MSKQKQPKKSKAIYWLLKTGSVITSCAFPMWAIYERFPIWTETHGKSHSIGTGGILCLIVLLVIFRKSVFGFMRDRLKLKHAPPIFAWFVLIIISYVLMYIGKVLYDITTICWMGLIGCGIGTLLTFIAENRFRKESENNE